ncbi:MAG: hypothetical protein L6R42_006494 [Xanthoria sp. 1 TBL-2021]|nr:MAG: hypothetical protein L6R42_006494 [Xanthoria sp. 1 TBL-2021]
MSRNEAQTHGLNVPLLNGHAKKETEGDMTLTVLGCGTLGIAILSGILTSLYSVSISEPSPSSSGTATPSAQQEEVNLPSRVPSRFIACVTRDASAKRVKTALSFHLSSVTILQNENLKGVQQADVIVLGCKPKNLKDGILREPGMREALKGKLVISILAGTSIESLEENVYGTEASTDKDPSAESRCRFVRVMPNTASLIRSSMTVIADSTPPLSTSQSSLVTWILSRIGRVVNLPPYMMDAATALCGSGPAFFALMLEAMADGAVAMGLPRAEAQKMAAQTMKGTAEMVLNGQHPALLREQVCTPGGCTAGGLQVLEDGKVRASVATGVRTASVAASRLGRGEQGVNGPR